MNNISLLVAVKNNIDYTKNFYYTTRNLYPDIEICFVSYDSIDTTNIWLEDIKNRDQNTQIFYTNDSSKCFSDTYNKAAQIATKEYIVFMHNDIIMYSNFIENISKHLDPNTIVSYSTIEPPIFDNHSRPGKLIRDCGNDLSTFDQLKFNQYANSLIKEYHDKTENGIVFFMALSRSIFLDIGGFDNLFSPFFREDDDLIKRLKMIDNIKYFTSLDALCYHFVSKTSRFSKEYSKTTQSIEYNSIKNYIRKWGSIEQNFTYKITFIIKNYDIDILSFIEPYCGNLYVDYMEDNSTVNEYINTEQPNTKIILKNKIHNISQTKPILDGSVCTIDKNNITNEDIYVIQNIQSVINKINQTGSYRVNNIDIDIYDLNTIHNNKIKI